jgi:N-acetyl-anhydromuramyl-L-alanine amidase AmpD
VSYPTALLYPPRGPVTPAPGPQPPDVPDGVPYAPRWVGADGNHYYGRSNYRVLAIVIHTMAGSLSSCDSWFNNPSAQVSSHYGIGLAGEQHQYVSLDDGSWANGILEPGNNWQKIGAPSGNPNLMTMTVETEDRGSGSTPVTEEQYQATLAVCLHSLTYFGSTVRWLLSHRDISPQSRPSCCGNRWWASGQFQRLADTLGLQTFV